MFCMKCGKEIENSVAFCQYCGTPTARAAAGNRGNVARGTAGQSDKVSKKGRAGIYMAGAACVLIAALIVGGIFLFRGILGGNGTEDEGRFLADGNEREEDRLPDDENGIEEEDEPLAGRKGTEEDRPPADKIPAAGAEEENGQDSKPLYEAAEESSPDQAGISYIGDWSKCRMTPEQADAFVRVLENLDIREGTTTEFEDWDDDGIVDCENYINYNNLRAALCDVNGDGIPALIVYYDMEETSDAHSLRFVGHEERIYLWNDGQAELVGTMEEGSAGSTGTTTLLYAGENNLGGYSWVEVNEQFYTIYRIENKKLVSVSSIEEHFDSGNNLTVVLLDGTEMEEFSVDDYESIREYEYELIRQAGGPIELKEENTDVMPVPSVIAALRAYAGAE